MRELRDRLLATRARTMEGDRAAAIVTGFQNENAPRIQALQQAVEEIQRQVKNFAQTQIDPKTGQAADPVKLMESFSLAEQRWDAFGRKETLYREYKTAALEPGLAPEQRRLLFRGALVDLAQALPDAELLTSSFPMPIF